MKLENRLYALAVGLCVLALLAFSLFRVGYVQAQLAYWGPQFISSDLWLHPRNQHVGSVATISEYVGIVEGLVPSSEAPDTRLILSIRSDKLPDRITTVEIPTVVLTGSFYVLQGDRGQEVVSYVGFVGSIRAGARINLKFEQPLDTGIPALTFGLITL